MKILWVSHLVPNPPKAGVLIRSHYLVKELAKHHDVDLLAFNQKNLMEPYFDSYEQGTEKSRAVLSNYLGTIEIIDSPIDKSTFTRYIIALKSLLTKYPYNINWLVSTHFSAVLAAMLQSGDYDLVHFDTIGLAPYLKLIDDKTLTSLDHHNVESHMLIRRSDGEKNLLKRWYFRQEGLRLEKVEQIECPRVSTNITCSDLDSERFENFISGANFTTIPNGVDIDFFKPSQFPSKNNQIIFIGTLDWYPNTVAAIALTTEIWPLLKDEHEQLELHIIGSNPPKNIIACGNSDKRVFVHGFVDDIIQPLNDATIYVCPISDGGGTKLKLLDAFAAGKAVVAHPVACEGLDITDEENILLASTPKEFEVQISRLLLDAQLRQKLEHNARLHAVRHFSFSSIGKQLADHFSSLKKDPE